MGEGPRDGDGSRTEPMPRRKRNRIVILPVSGGMLELVATRTTAGDALRERCAVQGKRQASGWARWPRLLPISECDQLPQRNQHLNGSICRLAHISPSPLPFVAMSSYPYDASLSYSVQCPPTAPLLGYSGAALAVIFSSIGAAYGTCKSGVGIAGMGVNNPGQVMKALIPVVMAGVIGIYGLIVAVIISTNVEAPSNQNFQPKYSLFTGAGQFFAGITIGLSGLAAGVCVGVVGDAGVRGFGQEPRLFVGKGIERINHLACLLLNPFRRHDFSFDFC